MGQCLPHQNTLKQPTTALKQIPHMKPGMELSWIMATVSEQVIGQIPHVEIAHEAWVELERSYGTHTPLCIMMLKKELNFIKKDGGDMVSYLDRVKSLANTLAAAGHPISTPDLVQITLNGLPEEYESLVTSVTTSTTIEKLTFNGLYDLLLNQEKRIQILKSKTSVSYTSENTQVAFMTYRGRGRVNYRGRRGGRFPYQGRPNNSTPSNADSNNNGDEVGITRTLLPIAEKAKGVGVVHGAVELSLVDVYLLGMKRRREEE
ncbi:Retrovirus-related Pol polyprotein from transposon TNT 1-94 [Nymphaea thermarum]|nr:Retrovirus-related Pol polyprotein from transposon TNT 1-94 [Nymphaea thermarum]